MDLLKNLKTGNRREITAIIAFLHSRGAKTKKSKTHPQGLTAPSPPHPPLQTIKETDRRDRQRGEIR